MLDASQKDQFERQGYLVLPDVVSEADLESIRGSAAELIDAFDIDNNRSVFTTGDKDEGRDSYFLESAERVHCFLEEEALDEQGNLLKPKALAINKIGHAMHDLVPAFTHFCRLPIFAELFRDLGYTAPKLWQSMYIFKQPKIGGEVRWHQDASYLNCGNSRLTGLWLALEDAHQDNGCLWVNPGGHRSPLREIFQVQPGSDEGNLRALDPEPWPDHSEAVALEVSAGSLVLFDGFMPHYSSPNRSSQSRQAFTMHVTEVDAPWSAENWLQRRNLPDFLL
ncbi:MAG: phytanoyl-CoA hydroxylase [Halieaceae bacterium]|jgi:phytanoyl-CoA hydroxylase